MKNILISGIAGLAFSSACISSDINMFDYNLKPIAQTEKVFRELSGQTHIIVFYEPDCHWCFKQIRLLNKLQESCSKTVSAGVALNGSRISLIEATKEYRPRFPVYLADNQLHDDLGEVIGTPFIIYANQAGHFVKYVRGFQSYENILSEISVYLAKSCTLK